jgi:Fe-S-cluster containining protein
MPASLSVARRFEMFDRTVREMEQRLLKVRQPAQMMTALRWGIGELDEALASAPAQVRASVACRAGCAHCCSVPVDVHAHEVFFAADHIQVNFSPSALSALLKRLKIYRRRAGAIATGTRDAFRQPCALLDAGSCSIYAGRPEACRSHHTNNATVCASYEADPSIDLAKVYIPALRARMFAVALGLDEAIEAAGYDERSYDFGSALHEALTDSLCLMRWMRRQSAFPDSCLSDPTATHAS